MVQRTAGLSLRLMVAIMSVMIVLVAMVRSGRATMALQFGQFNPADEAIFFYYIDVNRNLSVRLGRPLTSLTISNGERSPDGRQTVWAVQNGGNIDLYIVAADGTERQITRREDFSRSPNERESRRANTFVGWSPDGAWIAFVSSDVNNNLSLYVIRPDGSDLRQLGERIRVQAVLQPRWVMLP